MSNPISVRYCSCDAPVCRFCSLFPSGWWFHFDLSVPLPRARPDAPLGRANRVVAGFGRLARVRSTGESHACDLHVVRFREFQRLLQVGKQFGQGRVGVMKTGSDTEAGSIIRTNVRDPLLDVDGVAEALG